MHQSTTLVELVLPPIECMDEFRCAMATKRFLSLFKKTFSLAKTRMPFLSCFHRHFPSFCLLPLVYFHFTLFSRGTHVCFNRLPPYKHRLKHRLTSSLQASSKASSTSSPHFFPSLLSLEILVLQPNEVVQLVPHVQSPFLPVHQQGPARQIGVGTVS